MVALQAILVPIDGSAPSLAALEHAIVLAEDGDTRVDILRVDVPDELGVEPVSSLAPDARLEIERAFDDAVERARAHLDGRVSARAASGDPGRTIIETARDGRYDLIVIGTHGRTGRLHVLLGSVAEEVVRNAPCPVLTVRDTSDGYQSFAERRHGRPSVAEQVSRRP
ncbi:MAG TPA: universal stress protein [Kofleriaceae bacterium]|nr:universal stress protein [Kofleriaceae bacterium]